MHLEQPWWLIALLIAPLGTGLLLWFYFKGNHAWNQLLAPRLKANLIFQSSSFTKRYFIAYISLVISLTLLVFCLSRPQGEPVQRVVPEEVRSVVIALDLSRSMRVQDLKPDRLSQAKLVIYDMLNRIGNDRVGIVGFAGSAHVYAPLTTDKLAVREVVEQIDETWAPTGGSNLKSALKRSIELLKNDAGKKNALIVLSDGEETQENVNDILKQAAEANISIFSIAVGTSEGGFVPPKKIEKRFSGFFEDGSSPSILSRVKPETLRAIAQGTNGAFEELKDAASMTPIIERFVQKMDQSTQKDHQKVTRAEYYQWLLVPAIAGMFISILVLSSWSKPKIKSLTSQLIFLASLLALMMSAEANANSADQMMQRGDYDKAQQSFAKQAQKSILSENQYGYKLAEAEAAYLKKDYKSAMQAFSQALLSQQSARRARSHFGVANSLFQEGWQLMFKAPYDEKNTMQWDEQKFAAAVDPLIAEAYLNQDNPDEFSLKKLKNVVLNWSDALHHYKSSLREKAQNQEVIEQNQALVMTYLKALQKKLEQAQDQIKKAMQQAGEGSADPNQPNQDGEGQEDKPEKFEDTKKEGETPEERARRLLSENADTKRKPTLPGEKKEDVEPEKDY